MNVVEKTEQALTQKFDQQPIEVKSWIIEIIHELERARAKHPIWPNDAIHRAAIVMEESGELVRAALQYGFEKGAFAAMNLEALHTAATSLRFLIENGRKEVLKLVEFKLTDQSESK